MRRSPTLAAAACVMLAGCSESAPAPRPAAPIVERAAPAPEAPREGETPARPEPEAPPPAEAPGPEGTAAPMGCDELPLDTPIYQPAELREGGSLVRYGRLRSGAVPESADPLTDGWFSVERVDMNGDSLPDYLVLGGFFQNDEFVPDCGGYGECARGVVVSCLPYGHSVVVWPSYIYGLAAGTSTIPTDGRTWRTLILTERTSGSQVDEVERMDRGERVIDYSVSKWTPTGYQSRAVTSPHAQAEACARARRDGLDRARLECEIALDVAEGEPARGAMLHELGRVAELRGDSAGAIEMYRRSLAARPRNAVVQGRLDTLTAPSPP